MDIIHRWKVQMKVKDNRNWQNFDWLVREVDIENQIFLDTVALKTTFFSLTNLSDLEWKRFLKFSWLCFKWTLESRLLS